jgi:hypothetical protein
MAFARWHLHLAVKENLLLALRVFILRPARRDTHTDRSKRAKKTTAGQSSELS